VSVIDSSSVLILDLRCGFITGLVDRYSGFHAAGSQQLSAAGVAGGNISTVMSIVQRDHAAVVGFGDFDVVAPLAKGGTRSAGVFHVDPIAVVTGRRTSFDDDKLALIALGIIHLPAGIKLCAIFRVVHNGIGTIRISFHSILVVAAIGDILLGNS